ncbi:leucine-rich repeat domain-containing protein [Campylobacter coli]|uniref:leucine-rich repeat domain-containing protein n=10 Tax=Campylobacter coli TaxID=195 RepID=UPI00092E9866|nr:leucine-rich repeat domain-containing protein [Campylobacter coli]HEB7546208.1 leucine-rich repeat domain-containing protein [Campylobacter coli]HED6588186.1 leucine-rich repeat domain-containing protein [Campylobacter coli]HED6603557.1 leucine-rich repeat domain-containing protein [Campylobacter coli]
MNLTEEKVKSLGLDTKEEVVIPKDIKVIEKDTFRYNTKIRKVILNEGLEVIEKHAFRKCESLEEIILPDSLKSIGEYAFYDCCLKKLKLNEGLEVIENYAFSECESLEEIILPDSLKSIGEYAFKKCSSLKNLNFNEGLEVIENYAFYKCESLEEISLPDSLKEIRRYAFEDCSSLKNLNFNEGLEVIENYAFSGCKSLEEISFPDSLKEIGEGAFFRVYNLKRIHISKNHKYFGYENNVLYDKESKFVIAVANIQESISFPECIKRIGHHKLEGSSTLEEIIFPTSLKEIERYAFKNCSSIKSLKFNEGLEVIGENAFYKCKSLEVISLPDSLKEIGEGAFFGVYNLKRIHISKNHEYFGYENNVLYNKKKRKSVIAITNASEGITFPKYITAIPEDIFENPNLSKVVFENKNYKISEEQYFAERLRESIRAHQKEFALNKAKKEKIAEIIGVSFDGILQEIAKNYGVECILESKKCNQEKIVCILKIEKHTKILTTIKIKNPRFKEQFESFVKLVADKESTFESLQDFTKKHKNISFNKVFALHSYIPFIKLLQPDKEFLSLGLENLRVKIPQGTEVIPSKAFYKLKSLAFVELNDDLKEIDLQAFCGCKSLGEITLPNSVTTIGWQAFKESGIKQINLPESIKKISSWIFADCNSLQVVYGTKDSLAKKLAKSLGVKYIEIQE